MVLGGLPEAQLFRAWPIEGLDVSVGLALGLLGRSQETLDARACLDSCFVPTRGMRGPYGVHVDSVNGDGKPWPWLQLFGLGPVVLKQDSLLSRLLRQRVTKGGGGAGPRGTAGRGGSLASRG